MSRRTALIVAGILAVIAGVFLIASTVQGQHERNERQQIEHQWDRLETAVTSHR